jgi:hypothetical protein
MGRDIGTRRNDDGKLAAVPFQQIEKAHSRLRGLDLPDNDQGVSIVSEE